MAMDTMNEAQLVADLDRQIKWIDAQVQRNFDETMRKNNELLEKKKALQLRADAVRPRTIQFLKEERNDRQLLHGALNATRRELKVLGIALDRGTQYEGDRLAAGTWVFYPHDEGVPQALIPKLEAAGFPVEWTGSEGNSIVVHPLSCDVSYFKRGGWGDEPETVGIRPVSRKKGW